MNRNKAAFYGITLLLLVAAADFFTGPDVTFFGFYLLPVALYAWFLGIRAGCVMAFVAMATWYWIEAWLTGPPYLHPAMAAINSILRLVPALAIACIIAKLRSAQQQQAILNDKLTETVTRLEESLAALKSLQTEMQYVCAWTHRIRSNGRWISFEDFLRQNLHINLSHGISEEGAELFRTESDLPPLDGLTPDGAGAN